MRRRNRKGAGTTFQRGGSWYARWRIAGRCIDRTAGTERADAIGLLKAVERLVVRGGMDLEEAIAQETENPAAGRMTFAGALDLYAEAMGHAGSLKPRTLQGIRERASVLKKAAWATRPVGSFTRKDVRAWVAQRQAEGRSGGTLLNDLSVASACWRWLEDEEIADPDSENPFLRARPRRPRRKERRALDEAELRALLEATRATTPDLYPLLLAAVFSGWRGSELGGLREADLDLGERPSMTVHPREEKTGKDKTAYIANPLVALLKADREAVKRLPNALVFIDGQGRPWASKSRNARLREALAAVPEAKIPAWKRVEDDDHLGFDWHSLRHTVRSILSARGHRPAVLGELLGQANVATAKRYDHGYVAEGVAVAADVAKMLATQAPALAEA